MTRLTLAIAAAALSLAASAAQAKIVTFAGTEDNIAYFQAPSELRGPINVTVTMFDSPGSEAQITQYEYVSYNQYVRQNGSWAYDYGNDFDYENTTSYIAPGTFSLTGWQGRSNNTFVFGDIKRVERVRSFMWVYLFAFEAPVRYEVTFEGGVPEPATWALMIGGFGMAGTAIRRRRDAASGDDRRIA